MCAFSKMITEWIDQIVVNSETVGKLMEGDLKNMFE